MTARPLTKKFWQAVRGARLPAIIAINKMDRDRADFQMAFDSLASLGIRPVALQLPIRKGEEFAGYVDVLEGKAFFFGPDGGVSEGEIPGDLADDAALLRDVTVENIAESDETLMEQYLEEGSLDPEALSAGLRKMVVLLTRWHLTQNKENKMEILDLNDEEIKNESASDKDFEPEKDNKGNKKNKKDNKEETSAVKEILSWIFTLAIAVVAAMLIKNYVIINANIPSGSMENTIMPGDDIFGFRLAYTFSEPKRG